MTKQTQRLLRGHWLNDTTVILIASDRFNEPFHFRMQGTHCIRLHASMSKSERRTFVEWAVANPPKSELDVSGVGKFLRKVREVSNV
jgi:hypothetical protein